MSKVHPGEYPRLLANPDSSTEALVGRLMSAYNKAHGDLDVEKEITFIARSLGGRVALSEGKKNSRATVTFPRSSERAIISWHYRHGTADIDAEIVAA